MVVFETVRHGGTYPLYLQIMIYIHTMSAEHNPHQRTVRRQSTNILVRGTQSASAPHPQHFNHVRNASAKHNPHPHRIRVDTVRRFADDPRTQIRGFVRKCPPPRCSLVSTYMSQWSRYKIILQSCNVKLLLPLWCSLCLMV